MSNKKETVLPMVATCYGGSVSFEEPNVGAKWIEYIDITRASQSVFNREWNFSEYTSWLNDFIGGKLERKVNITSEELCKVAFHSTIRWSLVYRIINVYPYESTLLNYVKKKGAKGSVLIKPSEYSYSFCEPSEGNATFIIAENHSLIPLISFIKETFQNKKDVLDYLYFSRRYKEIQIVIHDRNPSNEYEISFYISNELKNHLLEHFSNNLKNSIQETAPLKEPALSSPLKSFSIFSKLKKLFKKKSKDTPKEIIEF